MNALSLWLNNRTAAGDSPVVIVDEAQGLSVRALDELRLLLNLENAHGKLLQIVLAGQPELDEKLSRPQLLELRQRIAVRKKLPMFSVEQCAHYIGVRLAVAGKETQDAFPADTIRAIHAFSGGIPRVVNLLCENALISACAEGEAAVSVEMVRSVAADFDFEVSNLRGDFSPIPFRTEIPAKLDLGGVTAPPRELELIPVHRVEATSPGAPEPIDQCTAAISFREAASPVAAIERSKARTVTIRIPRSGSTFLARTKDYFRELTRSFLRDWNRFLTSVIGLASAHKNNGSASRIGSTVR